MILDSLMDNSPWLRLDYEKSFKIVTAIATAMVAAAPIPDIMPISHHTFSF